MPEINIFQEFISSFLQIALGAVLVLLIDTIKKFLFNRPIRNVWDAVLSKDKKNAKLYIVIPSIILERLKSLDGKKWSTMPSNIHLLPIPEAQGLSELVHKLKMVYKNITFELCPAEFFSDFSKDFITIGGPNVNSVTKDLLLTHRIDKKILFEFDDNCLLDKADGIRYCDKVINTELIKDHGFTFITKNPLNSENFCVICCGIWAFGTNAAIRSLTGDSVKQPLFKKISENLKHDRGVFIVTETNIQKAFSSPPQIIKVRPLDT